MEERTVKLDLNTAREWYKKGGELQTVALQAYTKKELATDVKERIKTFEDALEELRAKDDKLVLQYYDYIDNIHVDDDNLLTYIKLRIICKALNERDVIFSKDILYYPYIRFISMKRYNALSDSQKERGVLFGGNAHNGTYAGFVFSYADDAPAATFANFGSRICLLKPDLAIYCCKQFPDLWLTYLTK